MDLNKQLDELIASVVFATRLSQNQIEDRLGYAHGRLSQAKSKGQVTARLLKLIQSEFKDELSGIPETAGKERVSNEKVLESILELMRTQNFILERQSRMMEEKVDAIDTNLKDALGRVAGLNYDLISGRQVVLQSLARLEGKDAGALLAAADNIKIALLQEQQKRNRAKKHR